MYIGQNNVHYGNSKMCICYHSKKHKVLVVHFYTHKQESKTDINLDFSHKDDTQNNSNTTEFYFHLLSCERCHRKGWVWWRVCQRLHKPHSQWCVDQ